VRCEENDIFSRPRGCPKTSVMNYHYTLYNNPEKRRSRHSLFRHYWRFEPIPYEITHYLHIEMGNNEEKLEERMKEYAESVV
jgi:hypothetical protein